MNLQKTKANKLNQHGNDIFAESGGGRFHCWLTCDAEEGG